jgi:hypothetical protein
LTKNQKKDKQTFDKKNSSQQAFLLPISFPGQGLSALQQGLGKAIIRRSPCIQQLKQLLGGLHIAA